MYNSLLKEERKKRMSFTDSREKISTHIHMRKSSLTKNYSRTYTKQESVLEPD
jgi:hypothetical protein